MHKRKQWDENERAFQTRMNQYDIEDAKTFIAHIEQDPKKEKRIAQQVCKVCTYRSQLAGQAFTNAQCAVCDTITSFPNTAVDVLCQPCATTHQVCKHCGADMD